MNTRDQKLTDLPAINCQEILGMEGIKSCVRLHVEEVDKGLGLENPVLMDCTDSRNVGVDRGGACLFPQYVTRGGKEK